MNSDELREYMKERPEPVAGQVAFLPWLQMRAPVHVAGVDFVPYGITLRGVRWIPLLSYGCRGVDQSFIPAASLSRRQGWATNVRNRMNRMKYAGHVVAIVVDPGFGDRVADLLERMPVWMADTETNHSAAARARTTRIQSQTVNHTAIGAVTTFTIEIDSTSESWCLGILDTVAGHHDHYSHSPGYSALEIYGETLADVAGRPG
jgi:hypothetical protein